ncbi:MAG: GGDEF domain-containing phosphodiesterase, partial [Actinomycetota bacterium]|nr:GGDEF domain-containing phosphodiesterase [Actinomycetota bacterium]
DGVAAAAEALVGRLRDRLNRPISFRGQEVFLSTSFGVSLFPFDARDARALLRHADAAMYQTKRQAPGGCTFFSKLVSRSEEVLALTTRLRRAVESAPWVLHHQPIVDLRSGRPVGLEALVRWRQPDGALIGPSRFISLAEESGLVSTITDWVVDELCRQLAAWRAEGMALWGSFNLSPRDLWRGDLVERVLQSLESHGLSPDAVVAEIVESAIMAQPETAQRTLWALHERGIRLAIDDFGTGHSSLSRLKDLPADIVKIDRSFVQDISDNLGSRRIVTAMLHMVESLGMVTLAEGIESRAQCRFLADRRCALGQGFLFSRPIQAQEVPERMRALAADAG